MNGLYQTGLDLAGWVVGRIEALINLPFHVNSRIYWLYLLTACLLAVWSYRHYYNPHKPFRFVEFLRFLCPRRIYLHPSAILDYKIVFANRFIRPGALLTGFVSTAAIATYVDSVLDSMVSPGWGGLALNGWTIFLFTLVYALVSDFVTFVNHGLHHRWSFLWPLHSVHHSAEVLTPITVYRKHPLYNVVKLLIRAPLVGVFQGITIFLFLGKVNALTILGINLFYALFLLVGECLRHTHIWFSFGPILNYIFISPAHHQIHHSARPEHRDCNFGEIFAIWDWMLGTLVLPTEEIRKNLVFGINLGEPQKHPSLTKAYLEPLQSMYGVMKRCFLKSATA